MKTRVPTNASILQPRRGRFASMLGPYKRSKLDAKGVQGRKKAPRDSAVDSLEAAFEPLDGLKTVQKASLEAVRHQIPQKRPRISKNSIKPLRKCDS